MDIKNLETFVMVNEMKSFTQGRRKARFHTVYGFFPNPPA